MWLLEDFWQDPSFDDYLDPDDGILKDVSLSDAIEDNFGDSHDDASLSSHLSSDGDSQPNSPIFESLQSLSRDFEENSSEIPVKEEIVEQCKRELVYLNNNFHRISQTEDFDTSGPQESHRKNFDPPRKLSCFSGNIFNSSPSVGHSLSSSPTIVIRPSQNGGASRTRTLYPKSILGSLQGLKVEQGMLNSNLKFDSLSRHGIKVNVPLLSTHKGCGNHLHLTEEEKRTLISEGYTVPSKLPLSKAEERSLKKVRRKIKNKMSAQESRRKKKEYLESLERKLERIEEEGSHWKRKCQHLEMENKQLTEKLEEFKAKKIMKEDDLGNNFQHLNAVDIDVD